MARTNASQTTVADTQALSANTSTPRDCVVFALEVIDGKRRRPTPPPYTPLPIHSGALLSKSGVGKPPVFDGRLGAYTRQTYYDKLPNGKKIIAWQVWDPVELEWTEGLDFRNELTNYTNHCTASGARSKPQCVFL